MFSTDQGCLHIKDGNNVNVHHVHYSNFQNVYIGREALHYKIQSAPLYDIEHLTFNP